MGVDLYVYGNHSIPMAGFSLGVIAKSLEKEMNILTIPNIEYLKNEELKFHLSFPPVPANTKDVVNVGKLKSIDNWSVGTYKSNLEYDTDDELCFLGPMGFYFIMSSTNIQFWNPLYRYSQWFQGYDPEWKERITSWRKYYYAIITLLKGNKAIYLADAFNNKYMDKFYTPGYAFSKIEQELIDEYGQNSKHLYEYSEDDYPLYYIDDFSDIANL
jgi:hypothetical protein